MIASTVLAVFFVPVFFVALQRLSELRRRLPAAQSAAPMALAESNGVPAH